MLIAGVIGFLALSVMILAHELGHFVTAKVLGVKVEEFGLGYPPRLLSFKKGETVYSLNAIPFGGFNKLSGEEDPSVPRSLASKSVAARLLILSAGSVTMFLLALLLFSSLFMIPRDVVTGQIAVLEVDENTPAEQAGVRPGDIILGINGKLVDNPVDLNYSIQRSLGDEFTLLLRHSDSTEEEIRVTPQWVESESRWLIGIRIDLLNPTVSSQYYPFWRAIPLGAAKFADTIILWGAGLVSVISGETSAQFLGPVALVQLTAELAQFGILPLLEIAAIISLILGICNLFPLPALDGGRIAFVLLEWLRRGKRVSPRTEGVIHLVGLAMLMAFLLAITYQDIIRVISGESLLP
ncbi:MAG: site-2 protease family protein [Dehalococcoidia bacterium]|nr:MAG: site-2 protease family protein [Dehalococcoidia bacterium]